MFLQLGGEPHFQNNSHAAGKASMLQGHLWSQEIRTPDAGGGCSPTGPTPHLQGAASRTSRVSLFPGQRVTTANTRASPILQTVTLGPTIPSLDLRATERKLQTPGSPRPSNQRTPLVGRHRASFTSTGERDQAQEAISSNQDCFFPPS